jgi:hypoxanthine phosphoribosyltransferase
VGSGLWARERLLTISWSAMGLMLTGLADQIRNSGFRPEVVVGIARGGLPPAVALANLLDVTEFRLLGIPRNASNSRYSERADPRYEYLVPDRPITGRRTLLVDDIMGDGGTMALARDVLRSRGVTTICTVVVVRNVHAAQSVDHHAVTADDWTVFPWEKPPGPAERTVALEIPE